MTRPWEYPGERIQRWAARWQSRYLYSRSYSDAERAGFWLGYRAGYLASARPPPLAPMCRAERGPSLCALPLGHASLCRTAVGVDFDGIHVVPARAAVVAVPQENGWLKLVRLPAPPVRTDAEQRIKEVAHAAWLWDCRRLTDRELAQLLNVLCRPWLLGPHPTAATLLWRHRVHLGARLDTLDVEWSASTDHTESGPETLDGAPE
jgi:hypothetical protein